eukprot:2912915-Amphidinium_carterae.1
MKDVWELAPARSPCPGGLGLPIGPQGQVSKLIPGSCWQDGGLPKVWLRHYVQQWTAVGCKCGRGPPSDAGRTCRNTDMPKGAVALRSH